jgi:hypothetical protein
LYQREGKTYKLGTLCVIDAEPREFSSEQLSLLETMAKLVVAEIEIREKNSKGSQNGIVKVHLFPRRKAGDHIFPEKGRLPVKVDRETVESLFGVPQPDAARALGISLTSLKQVCRKLGVTRWPYQRLLNPSMGPAGGAAGGAGGAAGGVEVQGAGAGAGSSSTSRQGGVAGMGSATAVHDKSAPTSSAPASRTAQAITGQMYINSSTLEVMRISVELERVLEGSPFPVVGQSVLHLVHPRASRRLWTFLCDAAAEAASSSHETLPVDAEEFVCQMLVHRSHSSLGGGMAGVGVGGAMGAYEVVPEFLECCVLPRVVGSDLRQGRMMLQLQLSHNNTESPVLPLAMSCAEMQTLLKRAGQFKFDDLASETDYPAISARSSKSSGLPDLWAHWEGKVRALSVQVPAWSSEGSAGGGASSAADRQHPSLECLNLLKQLDKRSGMRVIQNCTRTLIVPELHGNVIAVTCHIRFATPRDSIGINPLGAIADWHPSEGLFLGLAGDPVRCDGSLQFRQSIGHFVPTAYWDAVSSSLHIQIKRLCASGEHTPLTVYQSEYIVISEQEGRNIVVATGTIFGGSDAQGGQVAAPCYYRVVLSPVGNFE